MHHQTGEVNADAHLAHDQGHQVILPITGARDLGPWEQCSMRSSTVSARNGGAESHGAKG